MDRADSILRICREDAVAGTLRECGIGALEDLRPQLIDEGGGIDVGDLELQIVQ